ncbi:hypothetical protein BN1221_00394 [Brenneria goodwinii]|uniref:Uncharacterized protein n=1 Tax=Brenneria goodwinii TaxID=1109412 RepID=A0A0G4JPZ9_9GAMM|nr:hypothetical protein BN1221_00394 [Brenneria goodwinii]
MLPQGRYIWSGIPDLPLPLQRHPRYYPQSLRSVFSFYRCQFIGRWASIAVEKSLNI